MDLRKMLVLSTAVAAFLALIAILYRQPLSTSAHPFKSATLGPVFGDSNASVEVVVFEDLKCRSCRIFSEEVLPHIALDRIRFKIVPLGFLSGSKILANAALEVYQHAPAGFFPFVNLLFNQALIDSSNPQTLLDLAAQVGGVDLTQLRTCIERHCHYQELDRNLVQAKLLMGKQFRVPALYVNGVRVNTLDYQSIQQEIERAAQ